MSPQAQAVLWVLGGLAWLGLALCVAVAVGLTVREGDRRQRRLPAAVIEIVPDTTRFDAAIARARTNHPLDSVESFVVDPAPAPREWWL